MISFKEKVYKVVARIPRGSAMTYKEVARRAGSPRAYRAVGNIMRECQQRDIPCHRVIAAGGRLGGYGGNEGLKRALLVAEGVPVSGSRVRELDRVRWSRTKSGGSGGSGGSGRSRGSGR